MLLYICLSSFLFPVLSATDELVLVQAIWRHGGQFHFRFTFTVIIVDQQMQPYGALIF